MKISSNKKKFLIVALVVILFIGFTPRQSNAQSGIVGGILATANCSGLLDVVGGFLGGFLGIGEVPVKESDERKKENCLDHLAWVAVNVAIEDATKSTIDWINGDSGGGPRYVTDVEGFLGRVADDVIGSYIQGSSFGFVCDPFQLELRASLVRSRLPDRRVQCTLTQVVNNVDNFINGDFRDGGWNAWGELVTRSNPYIQYLQAESELEAKIRGKQEIELRKLQWGNGFLSWEVCPRRLYECVAVGPGRSGRPVILPGLNEEECKANGGHYQCRGGVEPQIMTPGSVIENQLNNVLDSGNRRLQAADEFNEIVSALLNRLLSDLFSPNGLRGLADKRKNRKGSVPLTGDELCKKSGICKDGSSTNPGPGGDPIVCIESCSQFCTTPSGGSETGENPAGPTCSGVPEYDDCVNQCVGTSPGSPPNSPPGNPPGNPPGIPPSGSSCAHIGGTPTYDGELQASINDVNSRNPSGVADQPNFWSQSRAYLDEVANSLNNLFGLNATTNVLNGNNNPSSGDLIAIWANGDTVLERYDAVVSAGSGGDTMRNAAHSGDFTGDIPLNCAN